jgi:glucosamine-6-phosphate deaminase
METETFADEAALAVRAADLIAARLLERPEASLGLASGRTPLRLYAELGRRARAGALDCSRARAFAVDELHGVPRDHPATNASYFAQHLDGLPLSAFHVMDSASDKPEAECARFRRLIEEAGGLDLVVLGIGANGHLAFNEPGSRFDSRCRRVALDRSTRESYAPFFGSLDATPAHGLTLGMEELLAARAVLLLASGDDKAEVVARALEGPLTEAVPASAVQRHPAARAILDRPAAARLRGQAAS